MSRNVIGYGLVVGGAAAFGGLAGDALVSGLFAEDPDADLWVADFGREGLPAPGPPEQR